jgi:hypothetical protein
MVFNATFNNISVMLWWWFDKKEGRVMKKWSDKRGGLWWEWGGLLHCSDFIVQGSWSSTEDY